MANMTFPVDQESGSRPRNYTRLTRLFLKTLYRTNVGDSNAANSVPLLMKAAPSQTANLIEVYSSANAGLFGVDATGNVISGGVPNIKACMVQVTLTAAQIITLDSVPVALVAAPGSGITLMAKACTFQLKYGTVQMTGGGACKPVYHGATTDLLAGSVAAATVKAAASSTTSCGGPAASLALTSNTGIDFYSDTADFAAGDSTAIVTLWYDQITAG